MNKNAYLPSVAAALFALGLFLSACGESERSAAPSAGEGAKAAEPAPAAKKAPAAEAAPEAEAARPSRSLVQLTCPVMGRQIDKGIFVDHKGLRVYFCCSACAEKFKKDPQMYLKRLEERGEAVEKIPSGTDGHKEHAH